MSDNEYYTEMVCENGHVITDCLEKSSRGSEFCDECGAKTITACPACMTKIRGDLIDSGIFFLGYSSPAPKYCHHCGAPYPWTRAAIESAQALAEMDDCLNEGDAEVLGQAIADSMNEGPKNKVAAMRIKQILKKAGKGTADAIRDIAVDVASETAKKLILG